MSSLDLYDAIASLNDPAATRVLGLVVDHTADLPDPGEHLEVEARLREAAQDVAPDGVATSAADLSRVTLRYLAGTPEHAEVVAKAIALPAEDIRLDPVMLGIGAIILVALQTEVELTRGEEGKWRLHIHQQAMRDSSLVSLVAKLLSHYRQLGQ